MSSCNQGVVVLWHPCNRRKATRPDSGMIVPKKYLITFDRYSSVSDGWIKDDVISTFYSDFDHLFDIERQYMGDKKHYPKVKAWAEMPEPYKKEN